jgi:hypothetical protein
VGYQDHSGAVVQREAIADTGQYGAGLDVAALRELAADALAAAEELEELTSD